jgi:4-amino-4-deoxy-L-arabinose transferase-like glycosyltransferase
MLSDSARQVGSERFLLAALALFAFSNALIWSRTVALRISPDEPGHFAVVRFEAAHGRIPELGVDDVAATFGVATDGRRYPYYPYSAQPGLAYLIDAAVVRASGSVGDAAVYAARLPGVVYAALMPLAVFWGAARMTRRRDAAILAAAISAVWPQLTFVFSYVNNDGLTALLSVLAIGSWYAGLAAGWRMRDVLRTALLAGLLLTNKPNGFFVAACSLAALATMPPSRRLARWAAALAAVAVSAGWWYAIAWSRYGADVLGYGRSAAALARLHGFWPSARHGGVSFFQLHAGRSPRFPEPWLLLTARSSVGAFGGMTLFLSPAEYWVVLLFVVAAALGLIARRGERRERRDWRRLFLHLLAAAVFFGLLLAAAYRSWAIDYQAQGRYLFPALLPFLALLALGLGSLPGSPIVRWFLTCGFVLTLLTINVVAVAVTLAGLSYASPGTWLSAHPLAIGVWLAAMTMLLTALLKSPAWSAERAMA